jgi:hypothetical protein
VLEEEEGFCLKRKRESKRFNESRSGVKRIAEPVT